MSAHPGGEISGAKLGDACLDGVIDARRRGDGGQAAVMVASAKLP